MTVHRQKLLEVDRHVERAATDCTDIVLVDRRRCPSCRGEVIESTIDEPALLRHGGYGATKRTRFLYCENLLRCGWSLVADVTEVRPIA